jgi:hypothetical protein
MNKLQTQLYQDTRFKKYNPLEIINYRTLEHMGLANYPIQLIIRQRGEQNLYALKILGETGEIIVPYHGQ